MSTVILLKEKKKKKYWYCKAIHLTQILKMDIPDVTKVVHVFGYLINSPGAEVRGKVTKGSVLHRVYKVDICLEEFTDGWLEVWVVEV